MLRTGAGDDGETSSILRMGGVVRCGLATPPLELGTEAFRGGALSSISSMLRIGDRGFVYGEEARPDPAELAGPLARPDAEGPSNKARTSLLSSSSIDSSDLCWLAMCAIAADSAPRMDGGLRGCRSSLDFPLKVRCVF